MFGRKITNNFQCTPCLISKMKESAVDIVDPEKILPHKKFHFELLRPIKPSFGANIHTAYFIQPTS